MTFEEWLSMGVTEGWVTFPMCIMHADVPYRDWEDELFEAGYDPCVLAMRVWKDGMENYQP